MIGGEQSGHIILGNYANTGDGILTAIMVMDIMAETKNLSSAMTAGLTILPQKIKNIKVEDKKAIMSDEGLLAFVDKVNEEFNGKGRLLLRASGTEPKVRIMVEAATEEECDQCIEKTAKEIEKLI